MSREVALGNLQRSMWSRGPQPLRSCDSRKSVFKAKMCPLFKRNMKKKNVVGEEKISLALCILRTEIDKIIFIVFSFVVELGWVEI